MDLNKIRKVIDECVVPKEYFLDQGRLSRYVESLKRIKRTEETKNKPIDERGLIYGLKTLSLRRYSCRETQEKKGNIILELVPIIQNVRKELRYYEPVSVE